MYRDTLFIAIMFARLSRVARIILNIYCTRISRVQRMHQSARVCHSLGNILYISQLRRHHLRYILYIYICMYLYVIPSVYARADIMI